MSIKQNFPAIKPTLNLDFANSRAVDSRIQFTRASNATLTDAQGVLQTVRDNKPRIDFDATTGECKGLLIEEQRTNLLPNSSIIYSDSLSTSRWVAGVSAGSQTSVLQPNSGIAPDGTMTADRWFASVGSSGWARVVSEVLSVANATAYTHSIWMKSNTGSTYTVKLREGYAGVTQTCTVTSAWQRFTFTATTTSTSAEFSLWLENTSSTVDILFWGPQLELGSFATSYIPTTLSFTSRNSSATYYDSTGLLRTAPVNGARYGYKYDSATNKWISQGLVLEAAATNLVDRSIMGGVGSLWQQYNTAVLTPEYTTAPDGTQTAGRITTTTNGTVRVTTSGLTNGTYYTASIWAKSNTSSNYNLYLQIGDQDVVQVTVTPTWQRFFGYGTPTQTGYNFIDIEQIQGGADISVWGAQLETGYAATSYIPTYSGAVTRAADLSTPAAVTRASDSAIINGKNFSSWYNSNAGTLYSESISYKNSYWNSAVLLTDDTIAGYSLTNRSFIEHVYYNSGVNQIQAEVIANGTTVGGSWHANIDRTRYTRIANGYDSSGFSSSANGGSINTNGANPLPTKINSMYLGAFYVAYDPFVGHIKKITYYPQRLSNTQLQALTA